MKNEIETKMDELGRKMKMLEDRQLAFDFENRELNEAIADLKEELKKHFLETKESARSQCLDVQYRKVGKPTVAFLLRDDDPWDEGM